MTIYLVVAADFPVFWVSGPDKATVQQIRQENHANLCLECARSRGVLNFRCILLEGWLLFTFIFSRNIHPIVCVSAEIEERGGGGGSVLHDEPRNVCDTHVNVIQSDPPPAFIFRYIGTCLFGHLSTIYMMLMSHLGRLLDFTHEWIIVGKDNVFPAQMSAPLVLSSFDFVGGTRSRIRGWMYPDAISTIPIQGGARTLPVRRPPLLEEFWQYRAYSTDYFCRTFLDGAATCAHAFYGKGFGGLPLSGLGTRLPVKGLATARDTTESGRTKRPVAFAGSWTRSSKIRAYIAIILLLHLLHYFNRL